MPREVAIYGLYWPTLMLLFVATALVAWGLDRLLYTVDAYRGFWHPALLRLSLFVCLFSAVALSLLE